jgi:hypothetical protein
MMLSDFERIVNDSMIDEDGREWSVSAADGWHPSFEGDVDEEWNDIPEDWPEDFQGEEEFA